MKNVKNKIKAIIFDMDGTIIKTEHIWQKVTSDILTLHGITTITPQQEKLLGSLSGIGLPKSCYLLKSEFNLSPSIEELMLKKIELAKNYFETEVKFVDGFENFHKKLTEHGFASGVATNADLNTLKTLSQKLNFENFFGQNLYCLEHVGNKAKPDPALFLHTAKQLNVKPEECIIFEDSLFGFQAANAAGMKCIAIKSASNKDHLHQAHDAIENYHEAEEALKKIYS